MIDPVVPGLVLVFDDGDVSTGINNFRDWLYARQYGHDASPMDLFVNDSGTLRKVEFKIGKMIWDDNDYAYPEVRLIAEGDDEHAPFCVITLRIDGRA